VKYLSLCDCVREDLPLWETEYNHLVSLRRFSKKVRKHYRNNPECDLRARQELAVLKGRSSDAPEARSGGGY